MARKVRKAELSHANARAFVFVSLTSVLVTGRLTVYLQQGIECKLSLGKAVSSLWLQAMRLVTECDLLKVTDEMAGCLWGWMERNQRSPASIFKCPTCPKFHSRFIF